MRLRRTLNGINQYGYRGQKKPKHTHTYPKTRVRVTLYDGSQFTDHYMQVDGRFHIFKERGKVKSSTIYQTNRLTKSEEMQGIIEHLEKGKK